MNKQITTTTTIPPVFLSTFLSAFFSPLSAIFSYMNMGDFSGMAGDIL
ncbi:MAG: hypothetical protein MR936_14775 [Eubacterium sp.]|nr:hypothetical protein [Eubacterium sp.]